MTLNLWPRSTQRRPSCRHDAHSWVVRQFRASTGYANLEICEGCGRTRVVLPGERAPGRTPVHAVAA